MFSLYELSKHVVKSLSVLYNRIWHFDTLVCEHCGFFNNRMLFRVIDFCYTVNMMKQKEQTMRYPEWMTEQDIMEFEYEMDRFSDWFEQGSVERINAECQAVAEEQRQAALEEYVAMIQQAGKTL